MATEGQVSTLRNTGNIISKKRARIRVDESYKFARIAALDLQIMGFDKEAAIMAAMAHGIMNVARRFPAE